MFVQVGKAGSDTMAVAEALGPARLARAAAAVAAVGAAGGCEEVISQLSRIGGGQPTGFGPAKILSLPDALARVLGRAHRPERRRRAARARPPPRPVRTVGDLCKECGQATLIYEEGCKKCVSCGYNEC